MPGTPEQVWDAIATARGLRSWFMEVELEERVGGVICLLMGRGRATTLRASADVPDTPRVTRSATCHALGAEEIGQPVEVNGLRGEIESITDGAVVVRLTKQDRGYLTFWTYGSKDGSSRVGMEGYLFSAGAADYVERGRATWTKWLNSLDTTASAEPAR